MDILLPIHAAYHRIITRGALLCQHFMKYNYEYFLKAVIPQAEKYEIKLALHPDDPPIEKLGGVSRII